MEDTALYQVSRQQEPAAQECALGTSHAVSLLKAVFWHQHHDVERGAANALRTRPVSGNIHKVYVGALHS